MLEDQEQTSDDIDTVYGLLEKISERQFDTLGRLTRQGVRLNQIEANLRQMAEVQEAHGNQLDEILRLLRAANP